MLIDTLKTAVTAIELLETEIKQMQINNNTLTNSIKTLEDEQREGYKTFNTESHVIIERSTLNQLINDVDDVATECDNSADSASQAQSDMENIEPYNAEEAYDSAKDAQRSAGKISDKLHDMLNTEDVQPIAEEGV